MLPHTVSPMTLWSQRDRWVYVVQGPPRPPGHPQQDGRDGWDGQVSQMPRGMINVPGVAPAPLDTVIYGTSLYAKLFVYL